MGKRLLRLVLAVSLDGRIAMPSGIASNIGGINDRKSLEESLAWADGVLIGGGTLRAHKNTCLIHNSELIKRRVLAGKTDQPIALIVSNQNEFPIEWQFFQQPIKRWLVRTNNINNTPKGFDNYVSNKQTWGALLDFLDNSGLSRLALLGGCELTSSLIQEDLVDELQLSIIPKIIGGKYCWIKQEAINLPKELSTESAWKLKMTKYLGKSELLLNYLRVRQ